VPFADYTRLRILSVTFAYEIFIMIMSLTEVINICILDISVIVLIKMKLDKKCDYSPALFLMQHDELLIYYDVTIKYNTW